MKAIGKTMSLTTNRKKSKISMKYSKPRTKNIPISNKTSLQ